MGSTQFEILLELIKDLDPSDSGDVYKLSKILYTLERKFGRERVRESFGLIDRSFPREAKRRDSRDQATARRDR